MKTTTFIFLILLGLMLTFSCAFANEKKKVAQNDISILSDKSNYPVEDMVKLTMTNNNVDKDFVYIGSCGLTLEKYSNGTWEEVECPWSGCPFCGHQREIPEPIFLSYNIPSEIKWDQLIACCIDGEIKEQKVTGTFRFSLNYAEDTIGCKSNNNPFRCWIDFREKKWMRAYSNEFNLGGEQ